MSGPLLSLLVLAAAIVLALLLFRPERGIVPRIRRSRRRAGRILVEDALKHVQESGYRGPAATLQSLAGVLSIGADEAAALAGRMEQRGLLRPEGTALVPTPEGRRYALQVIRAHRLWEQYLAEETGVPEEAWHSRAERREHELTPPEVAELAARLGHPRYDPHGDPIPTERGEIPSPGDAMPLTELAADRLARIIHLEDEPPTAYAQLLAEGLQVGTELRVTDSGPMRIRFYADGDEHVLAPVLAAGVTVEEVMSSDAPEPEEPSAWLADLELGESAEIVSISRSCRGLERRRLMDLGVVPGTLIEAVLRSPSGDPTAYRLRETTIAIRRTQAERIRVRQRTDEDAA